MSELSDLASAARSNMQRTPRRPTPRTQTRGPLANGFLFSLGAAPVLLGVLWGWSEYTGWRAKREFDAVFNQMMAEQKAIAPEVERAMEELRKAMQERL